MSNGGRYFNEEYGGEVYYDTPSMLGAAHFVEDLVFKHKVMPQGVTEAARRVDLLLRRQGLDGAAVDRLPVFHAREHEAGLRRGLRAEERAQRRADRRRARWSCSRARARTSRKAGWKFIKWLTSPETLGGWSRFTGYFAPRKSRLRHGRDEGIHRQEPGRQGGARPAALRQAVVRDLPDRGRAQGAGGRDPGDDERQEEGRRRRSRTPRRRPTS